jgi:hypothetical protein
MKWSTARQTRWDEYATRFMFGGMVTLLAGLIADRFGPAIGGLFLAFPAIFPASASLIQRQQKEKKQKAGFEGSRRGRLAAGVDASGAALGTCGLIAFATAAWILLGRQPLWLVLTLSTLLWAAVCVTLWLTWRGLRHARNKRNHS